MAYRDWNFEMFRSVLYSSCRLELWTFMGSYFGVGELEILRQS